MDKIKDFQDLKVWRDAHQITLDLYKITETFPHQEMFGLTSQVRRSASSIGANIAEGFGRYHYKDKAKFYLNARGSAIELENHVLLARDLNYITIELSENLLYKITEVLREINGLIRVNKEF